MLLGNPDFRSSTDPLSLCYEWMLRGSLTPLGRQLRSVLANIRPPGPGRPVQLNSPIWSDLGYPTPISTARYFGDNAVRRVAATAFASLEDDDLGRDLERQSCRTIESRVGLNPFEVGARVQPATRVPYDGGYHGTTWNTIRPENSETEVDSASQHGLALQDVKNKGRKIDRVQWRTRNSYAAVEKILKRYIKHTSDASEAVEAEWMHPFELSTSEAALLDSGGYSVEDVKAWTKILSDEDALIAAKALQSHIKTHGSASIPVFVPMYILRRPYVSARALRILVEDVASIFKQYPKYDHDDWSSPFTVYVLFSKLVDHARRVWPRALEKLPEMLLEHLTRQVIDGQDATRKQLATLTLLLNRAMRLLAVPSAVNPIKNNHFQEAGIVRILRFMAEHDPPLQIDREGYRAVVLVQLGQKKSVKEQQWAELKGLSWPPWKEERTAMDSDITREDHGTSKAGRTLRQMREAGYGDREWEKVASIYTGWDTDLTPTIQTLVMLGGDGERFKNGSAAWIARITTTRTMQEAWACYLAYEDAQIRADQAVWLAMLQKLRKEEERHQRHLRHSAKETARAAKRRDLYPGDAKEIEPLPPSTHLYTYTRTTPPSFDGFYRQLRERGAKFNGYCLAYLVANASSLKSGLMYLQDAGAHQSDLLSLMSLGANTSVLKVSMPVFTAFIELASRFSKVPLSSAIRLQADEWGKPIRPQPVLDDTKLNTNHVLVHAIELLKERRPLYRPPFNHVLQALGHESSLSNIRSIYAVYTNKTVEPSPKGKIIWRGAITAYRLVRRVLSLMRELHLDLDAIGFLALCRATENTAIGCWMLMLEEERREHEARPGVKEDVHEAIALMRSSSHAKRLKGEFCILVGDDAAASNDKKAESKEMDVVARNDLLETPSSAILHAYVRSLGWMADYQGLLDTVRWMAAKEPELADRRDKDRNGETSMRKAVVALRVFLERSWLSEDGVQRDQLLAKVESHEDESRLARQLRRFRSRASEQIINEVRGVVDDMNAWNGWPEDEEVEEYCKNQRFQQFQ